MLSTLIASNARKRRTGSQIVASVCLHVAVGAGVIHATRPGNGDAVSEVKVIHLPYRAEPRPAPPVHPRSTNPSEGPIAAAAASGVINPPLELPLELPPVGSAPAAELSRSFRTFSPSERCIPRCAGEPTGEVYRDELVDEPAAVLVQPRPRYPPLLAAAGATGRVSLQFVVDTAGAVELGSVSVLEPAHEAFVAAARKALDGSRFSPARIRGRAVRQLVRQTIAFRLDR